MLRLSGPLNVGFSSCFPLAPRTRPWARGDWPVRGEETRVVDGTQELETSGEGLARRQQVAARLRTVEGQLRAVRKMVTEGQDCLTIATQASAALEGLRGAMKILLRDYMDECLDEEALEGDREAAYDKFVDVLDRFIR